MALGVLVALDEIVPRDRLAVADAHALELHRRLVLRVQHAEMRPMIAHRRVQLDRNVDQTERDRAFPQCSAAMFNAVSRLMPRRGIIAAMKNLLAMLLALAFTPQAPAAQPPAPPIPTGILVSADEIAEPP